MRVQRRIASSQLNLYYLAYYLIMHYIIKPLEIESSLYAPFEFLGLPPASPSYTMLVMWNGVINFPYWCLPSSYS